MFRYSKTKVWVSIFILYLLHWWKYDRFFVSLQVSIGCPEKMEPITKVSHIPASRWALSCSLCREHTGTCIQVPLRRLPEPSRPPHDSC